MSLSSGHSLVPVLYVGYDLSPARERQLHAHRIGVIIAETPARASRMLTQFRPAAIVSAVPDLQALDSLMVLSTPIVLLAACTADCDLDNVTILARDTHSADIAAVIHGLVSTTAPHQGRRAA